MENTILVVDDEQDFAQVLHDTLTAVGYQVLVAHDGRAALRLVYQHHPDLVVLDLVLPHPELNGIVVCRRIREVSDIPIIMLTAQEDPEDIVDGLEAGADDYITKPYQKDVLIARVRANLRRYNESGQYNREGIVYSDDYLTINLDERRIIREGEVVRLSPTEFNLLVTLVEQAPRVVAYRELLEKVWGQEYIDDIDYLRVYVWHLRRKLERDPKHPVYIVNELGVGYRFEKQF